MKDKTTSPSGLTSAQYSGKENWELEGAIDKYMKQLVALIRRKYLSSPTCSRPMDLGQKTQFLTLDVISYIGFGQSFGDLEADADANGYIHASRQGLGIVVATCALGIYPILQWPPLARLIGPSEKEKSGLGKMMATARGIVNARLEKPTDQRTDMLASFMRHGLTKDELFTEAFLQIIAGSDTTATAIRATMLYIISHPQVYLRLREEIDGAVAAGIAPEDIVPDAVAKDLPYLQAVLREGVRIHPPASNIGLKRVPKGGDSVIVDGRVIYLPGGTNVGVSVFGMNRRKDIFGEDVDLFRPERWLPVEKGDEERIETMRRTTELIWGHGRYQCLGKNIAWMEYNKAVFEVC